MLDTTAGTTGVTFCRQHVHALRLPSVEFGGRVTFHCVGKPGPGTLCQAIGGISMGVFGYLGLAMSVIAGCMSKNFFGTDQGRCGLPTHGTVN